MASPQYEKLVRILWERRVAGGSHPVEALRAGMAAVALPAGDDVTATPVDAGGIPAEWVRAGDREGDGVILYLHGGGYVMGSLLTHRKLAGDLARASGARVLLLDYRLAPEHALPAGIDDGVAAYRWLLAEGVEPAKIAIGGDSAGGGLTVAVLLALRDAGIALPGAGVCISPWANLMLDAPSIETRADRDPVVNRQSLQRFRDWYVAGTDPRAALASPVFADLRGLPPLLIHVGDAEILLDDARALADRAEASGVDVTLEIWPDMVHVWHIFAGRVPEATAAVERIGAFLTERLAVSPV